MLVTTLTTVGYGIGITSYKGHAFDTTLLIFLNLFGLILFSVFTQMIQVAFINQRKNKSILEMIAGLENNITLYVIDHNSLYNVKLMDGKDI